MTKFFKNIKIDFRDTYNVYETIRDYDMGLFFSFDNCESALSKK